uniref:Uncharacterized protein n=1 Tax=Avena sativa TaxID=4498 RepID=A0ACD5YZW0_AVESA
MIHDGGATTNLAATLQAMSLTDPGLCRVRDHQVIQKQRLDFFNYLPMKVACTGGTPRRITQPALEQAMSKAWRNSFYAISQVSNTVFMAHFRNQEYMISVYTRQSWSMNSEIMLLDWFDPNLLAETKDEYKFEHILVTVRAYGIPRNRSLSLLEDILNQVGTTSEYHILQDNNLFARQDYIWGIAKMKVESSVKDRVIVNYSVNSTGIAYLHYEKIRRICLFCGVMFHIAHNCTLRNNLITERSKSNQTELHIPRKDLDNGSLMKIIYQVRPFKVPDLSIVEWISQEMQS